MQRRKFIVGLGSLAAGGAAAMGTGAFSKMNTGDRTVGVRVANDANAFVTLKPSGMGRNENGQFARYKDGKLYLRIDGSTAQRGSGPNPDSTYSFDNVFQIMNKGERKSEHHLWISSNTADRVNFYWQGDPSNSAEGPNNSWKVLSGYSIDVGMSVDASGLGPDDKIKGNVVISAENAKNAN